MPIDATATQTQTLALRRADLWPFECQTFAGPYPTFPVSVWPDFWLEPTLRLESCTNLALWAEKNFALRRYGVFKIYLSAWRRVGRQPVAAKG